MLKPRRENTPATLASTPAWFATITARVYRKVSPPDVRNMNRRPPVPVGRASRGRGAMAAGRGTTLVRPALAGRASRCRLPVTKGPAPGGITAAVGRRGLLGTWPFALRLGDEIRTRPGAGLSASIRLSVARTRSYWFPSSPSPLVSVGDKSKTRADSLTRNFARVFYPAVYPGISRVCTARSRPRTAGGTLRYISCLDARPSHGPIDPPLFDLPAGNPSCRERHFSG